MTPQSVEHEESEGRARQAADTATETGHTRTQEELTRSEGDVGRAAGGGYIQAAVSSVSSTNGLTS
jgi:hypothetical protein